MRFPYHVLELDEAGVNQWRQYFADGPDRRRDVEEGIWRRTQEAQNADQSGWTGSAPGRRRIIHFRYRYQVSENKLELVDFYLYWCVTWPSAEIDDYRERLTKWLAAGGWIADGNYNLRRGDLRIRFDCFDVHPEDALAGRAIPAGSACLQATVISVGHVSDQVITRQPWQVLASGRRIKDQPGRPTVIDTLAPLLDFLPFQVEVGCGTSVEAGIPPLHRLHQIYRVTTRSDNQPGTGDRFVLHPDDDILLREVIEAPELKFVELTEMYRACFRAKPTPALEALAWLAREGHLVGPVITNNFDVLTARAGLDECFVRRYDQTIPDIDLRDDAKALLVVGNHADRRKVEARARAAGKQIIFCDPEGFWHDGQFAPYPLEGAQTGDLLCRKTAAEALLELVALLKTRHPHRVPPQ